MYQSVNLFLKIAVLNVGYFSAYFCGGYKNNLRLQFRSSFNNFYLTRARWYTRKDKGMNDQIVMYGKVDFIFLVHYTMNSLSYRHGYRKVLSVRLK